MIKTAMPTLPIAMRIARTMMPTIIEGISMWKGLQRKAVIYPDPLQPYRPMSNSAHTIIPKIKQNTDII